MPGIRIIDFPGRRVDGDPSCLPHVDFVPAVLAESSAKTGNIHESPDDPGGDPHGPREGCKEPRMGAALAFPNIVGIPGRRPSGNAIGDFLGDPSA